jgi:hypothetical protein
MVWVPVKYGEMRKSLAPLTALFLASFVLGCGGANSLIPNTLDGNYSGTGTVTPNNDSVTANITIDSSGNLSGTMKDVTTNNTATVSGNVSLLGVISNGSVQVTNSVGTSLGSGTLSGTFTQTNNGVGGSGINGTLTTTVNSTTLIYSLANLGYVSAAAKIR